MQHEDARETVCRLKKKTHAITLMSRAPTEMAPFQNYIVRLRAWAEFDFNARPARKTFCLSELRSESSTDWLGCRMSANIRWLNTEMSATLSPASLISCWLNTPLERLVRDWGSYRKQSVYFLFCPKITCLHWPWKEKKLGHIPEEIRILITNRTKKKIYTSL